MGLTVSFESSPRLANIQMPPVADRVTWDRSPLATLQLPRPPTGPVFLTNDDWSAFLVDEDTGKRITA